MTVPAAVMILMALVISIARVADIVLLNAISIVRIGPIKDVRKADVQLMKFIKREPAPTTQLFVQPVNALLIAPATPPHLLRVITAIYTGTMPAATRQP